jgi:hypothetical protein
VTIKKRKQTKKKYYNGNTAYTDGKAPIRITTLDIAKLLGISVQALRTREHRGTIKIRSKDMWKNLWELVQLLESKGLRPDLEQAMPALCNKLEETVEYT